MRALKLALLASVGVLDGACVTTSLSPQVAPSDLALLVWVHLVAAHLFIEDLQ